MRASVRHCLGAWLLAGAAMAWAAGGEAGAPPASAASPPGAVPRSSVAPLARAVPLVLDRLRAADLGLVINLRDPYSVAVGNHYAEQRGLAPQQILRVDLPAQAVLTPQEFAALQQAIERHFDLRTQALALAWVAPYAVGCNSITGALAMGYDPALCAQTCAASRPSPYANSRSSRPYTDFRMRPSMLLAARSIEDAKALIERGVRADGSLARAEATPAEAVFVTTPDGARNVRAVFYPPDGTVAARRIRLRRVDGLAEVAGDRLLFVSVGQAQLKNLPATPWLPGALADHLTSMGGDLLGAHDQSTALEWIASGATASHGTVSEPCNHLHKFPQPQWLLLHYLQGATALEAYWKSVLWPQQSLFIGEPLAAPFAAVRPREAAEAPR